MKAKGGDGMTIGESIRYHRKRLGLTQAELADRLGVTPQAVSKWESGVGLPDITMAVPLARALGTTTDELLRFGERYQEWEALYVKTVDETKARDPKALLEVSLAALKEFPYDRIFLYRAAVWNLELAVVSEDDNKSRNYLGEALVHAWSYRDMSPGDQQAKDFYKRMMSRCQLVNGLYELKPEFRGPDVRFVI